MNLGEAQALLDGARIEAAGAVDAAGSPSELDELERRFLGKGSPPARVNEAIKTLEPGDRPVAGRAVSAYKAALGEQIEARRTALTGAADAAAVDGEHLDLSAGGHGACLLYTSPSPRDGLLSRMPSSA